MANTVKQSFEKLKSNLEVTNLQVETISKRHTHVREVVEKGLDVLDSFLTGSYSRHTMIGPLKDADIDIFVVLDSKYFKTDGQAYLLDNVREVLKKTFTKSPKISRNGQAVTITFTDFIVDVVPGFYRKGGGYLIPNTIISEWIPTDCKKHVSIMSSANKYHKGNLVPLIKMIKCWNRANGYFFSSFHLEVLAMQILNNVTIADYSSGIRYFFDKGKDCVSIKNPDPAGYHDDVGSYLNTQAKIDNAKSRFKTAFTRAVKAENYDFYGSTKDAVAEWGKIFCDKFPASG